MRSLRSRLILGTAAVAVIPLALAVAFLSQRVGSMVREDAATRLDASLRGLGARLRLDQEAVTSRLAILARDATLKRLYLVRSGDRELAEYLDERRTLLGLDYLTIADPAGRTVAGNAPDSTAVAVAGFAPVLYDGRPQGMLRGGIRLDTTYLGRLKESSGVDLALSNAAGGLVASTRPDGAAPPAARLERSVPVELGTAPYPMIRAMVDTAAAESDPARRRDTLQQAESLMLNDYPLLPVYFYVTRRLVSARVAAPAINPMNRTYSRYFRPAAPVRASARPSRP